MFLHIRSYPHPMQRFLEAIMLIHTISQRLKAISLQYKICCANSKDKENPMPEHLDSIAVRFGAVPHIIKTLETRNSRSQILQTCSKKLSKISRICLVPLEGNCSGRKTSCFPEIRFTPEFNRSRAFDATRHQLGRYSERT